MRPCTYRPRPNDHGSLRQGTGEDARDHVEDEAEEEAVTAPLEAADSTAAELKGGGPVV